MIWVFWVALSLIAYTYAGYPFWLWSRGHVSPRPVLRGCNEPTVTAIMVVRNEEAVLTPKIENLFSLNYPAERLDLVIVSDGSTDSTPAILKQFEHTGRLRAHLRKEAEGKASGLNEAVQSAGGELVFFTDARQYIEPGALRCLVENFADDQVGAASGELMLGDPASGETERGMGAYWRMEKKVRELESASGSVAGATGAIYCARRALLKPIPPDTILDDVLIPMQIVREGGRVIFDGRARAWDSPDLGRSREFARKVRTLSGNYQLLQLAPWLLSAGNPIRFEFICHKLLRLLVPFALVALLVSSASLSQAFYRVFLIAQLAFYALSLMAIVEINIGPLSRVADSARTFVVLNSAAVVALANFVTRRKVSWVR